MRQKDVPQDRGVFGPHCGVCYAVDDNDRFVLEKSEGWDPANLANIQAWEEVRQELEGILEDISSGDASPLLYHMKNQLMDIGMLAAYSGQSRWRVRKQLKKKGFARIPDEVMARYAKLFRLSPEAVKTVPKKVQIPFTDDEMKAWLQRED